jgi:hypothetical protein
MAVWEMTAVKLAAEHFDLDEDWTLATDNAAVERALIRGHSGNAYMDGVLRELIRQRSSPVAVRWVPSECQRVDPLTRPSTFHFGIKPPCMHYHPAMIRRFL